MPAKLSNSWNPLVSIVIPVYNGSNFLREAINSAIAQTYTNTEIIVVNDGSNDDGATRSIALSYGDKIRYFEKENGGVASALNLAIKEARGDYFSWLSHDDLYYPEKVEKEINAIRRTSNSETIAYSNFDTLIMQNNMLRHRRTAFSKQHMNSFLFAVCMSQTSGCSLLIPMSLFQKYGGFDERQKTVQDYAKWFDLRHCPAVYVDEPLIISRMHDQQGSVTMRECHPEQEVLYRHFVSELKETDVKNLQLSFFSFLEMMLVQVDTNRAIYERLKSLEEPEETAHASEKVMKWLQQESGSTCEQIYIYCAGVKGKKCMKSLQAREVKVVGFADSNVEVIGKECLNKKIYCRSEIPKNACVIVAKIGSEDLVQELKSQGFLHVIGYEEMGELFLNTPFKKIYLETFLND